MRTSQASSETQTQIDRCEKRSLLAYNDHSLQNSNPIYLFSNHNHQHLPIQIRAVNCLCSTQENSQLIPPSRQSPSTGLQKSLHLNNSINSIKITIRTTTTTTTHLLVGRSIQLAQEALQCEEEQQQRLPVRACTSSRWPIDRC